MENKNTHQPSSRDTYPTNIATYSHYNPILHRPTLTHLSNI